jgi:hypothetical protein
MKHFMLNSKKKRSKYMMISKITRILQQCRIVFCSLCVSCFSYFIGFDHFWTIKRGDSPSAFEQRDLRGVQRRHQVGGQHLPVSFHLPRGGWSVPCSCQLLCCQVPKLFSALYIKKVRPIVEKNRPMSQKNQCSVSRRVNKGSIEN